MVNNIIHIIPLAAHRFHRFHGRTHRSSIGSLHSSGGYNGIKLNNFIKIGNDDITLYISTTSIILIIVQILVGIFIYKLWTCTYTNQYHTDKISRPTCFMILFIISTLIPMWGLMVQALILCIFFLKTFCDEWYIKL
jgi:heme/copper-type cytochrome/quinol oxidase subunit 2